MKVLLSCEGTSDPIRGYHDGPMLHILRKFRPEVVVIFASTEIQELNQWDNRHAKIRALMKNSWGYEPEWCVEPLNLKDVQDLDLVYDVMEPALKKYLRKYAQEEFLINVTSGTPQMQHLLIDIAKDVRYTCHAIQVANPDKASGSGGRTNDRNYYQVDEQIQGNKDELPGCEDRCNSVKMFAVERKNKWEQLRSILELRDFETASKMDMLPVGASRMLKHLQLRSRLRLDRRDKDDSFALVRSLLMSDKMFPICFRAEDEEAERICEFYLTLRNMQKTGRLAEFVLRINPFIVQLQIKQIDQLLQQQYGFRFADITYIKYPERTMFSVEKLNALAPELLQKVNANFNKPPVRDADISIKLGKAILKSLGVPEKVNKLYNVCDEINDRIRNPLAHDLEHFTEYDFYGKAHCRSDELIREIEDLIPTVFPQYPEEAFRKYYQVYDVGIEYILKQE